MAMAVETPAQGVGLDERAGEERGGRPDEAEEGEDEGGGCGEEGGGDAGWCRALRGGGGRLWRGAACWDSLGNVSLPVLSVCSALCPPRLKEVVNEL